MFRVRLSLALGVLASLVALLACNSCTALHADDTRIAADSTSADTAVVVRDTTARRAAASPRRPHPRRVPVAVDAVAPVEPVPLEHVADASNPACVQLVAAEHRLRIAKARYDEAMVRFNRATQRAQERASDRDEVATVDATPAYPVAERQEYLQASMAVTSLRAYCPDVR